jgi:hypothetical protein
MGFRSVAKKTVTVASNAKAAAAARHSECHTCGKKIRGGAGRANTCSRACAQFAATHY